MLQTIYDAPNCDCRQETLLLYYLFIANLFSDIYSFSSNLILLISAVLCNLSFFAINAVQGELVLDNSPVLCSSLTARLQLRLESSTHNLSIFL